MFRNPRENASLIRSEAILPSTGRPPTPPQPGISTKKSPYFPRAASTEMRKSESIISPTPALGRQSSLKLVNSKKNGPKNQSILNFFGKAEKAEEVQRTLPEANLFFDESKLAATSTPKKSIFSQWQTVSPYEDNSRYNEDTTPVKKRRVDASEHDDIFRTPSPERAIAQAVSRQEEESVPQDLGRTRHRKSRGGFVDESSDEEGGDDVMPGECTPGVLDAEDSAREESHMEEQEVNMKLTPPPTKVQVREVVSTTKVPLKPSDDSEMWNTDGTAENDFVKAIPKLTREGTSAFAPGEFGEDDDFEDDEFFEEGEEFLERRWMQEQREMEIGLEDDSRSESGTEGPRTPTGPTGVEMDGPNISEESVAMCPICNGSMSMLSEVDASAHVNACLDGTATPLPKHEDSKCNVKKQQQPSSSNFTGSAKRFQRAAIARPAQANPFDVTEKSQSKGSAFSRLMSGHAEDAAWAEAAANEVQSRGKPAYQRTCPFYKIMPGFYICVDAFRYGKVEGQNAYFLSHFHSDHYIGLTSQWCHGPIYASKVTCNLMRQQLRVDSKWLRPLEFDKKIEVPDTNGVYVTMIPANHCPGSSLYLFEKTIGKNKDGSPRTTRVLHCGDFRACPAHVHHPLLMPDVVDAITGQTKQQVIDTCYLDTTYLTPKYSFPSQSDVIDACAQMCVSLSKEIVDSDDSWEKVKLAKAGSAMKKFLEKGEQELVKKEDFESEEKKPKLRGRLLVVIGTYSIGKERICLGIARALKSKIYAPPAKMRICKALEDADLNGLLTNDPLEAQIHMQTLMEIRADTLHDYLITFKGHFHRVVGFRPTGWTYRPPKSRFTDNPAISTVLNSDGWKSRFTMHDLAPQRGSTRASNCFGVPYSEHSSFRELTMFCCALRINKVVPTVNVGSAKSRERMKGWIEKWDAEKKKNGLFKVEIDAEGWGSGDGKLRYGV